MERSNFLVAIIKLILRSLAIIPGWFVSLGHEIVTFLFILEIWGNAGDAFSSTSVGKYGFGHYDLNPPAYSALFDHGLASKSDQRFASIRSTG
ncbi:hypothetical protein QU800_20345, partial [Escherichia coli]|nr:hypothetical protein [Escherichia coli]